MRPHPLLFELSTWPWLERLSQAARRRVTLQDVPSAEWDRIAAEGFDLVFLMGVWTRSAIGAKSHGRIRRSCRSTIACCPAGRQRTCPVAGTAFGSEPDDRMGGWSGLDAARRELKARGIGLILDFVPNHTAFDHPWVTRYPQRYVLGDAAHVRAAPADFRAVESVNGVVHVACGRDPYFLPWRDVAQLNYFNPETRAAMRGVLREVAAHCDGVRCDMAMLLLNDVFERTWRARLGTEWRSAARGVLACAGRQTPISPTWLRSTGISRG